MRRSLKTQDAPTAERERLIFDANLILVSKADNPGSLEWVARGTKPWRRGEEYRLIQLVEGGWSKGFHCIEDIDDFLAGSGYQELIERNELVKAEFDRFVTEKKASERRRLPRSPETILSSTNYSEYMSRNTETLDVFEVDEAIRLNNEWLAANRLDRVDFNSKVSRFELKYAWKQRQLAKTGSAVIVYLKTEYLRGREYLSAWFFNWSCSGPYPNCETPHDCEVHR